MKHTIILLFVLQTFFAFGQKMRGIPEKTAIRPREGSDQISTYKKSLEDIVKGNWHLTDFIVSSVPDSVKDEGNKVINQLREIIYNSSFRNHIYSFQNYKKYTYTYISNEPHYGERITIEAEYDAVFISSLTDPEIKGWIHTSQPEILSNKNDVTKSDLFKRVVGEYEFFLSVLVCNGNVIAYDENNITLEISIKRIPFKLFYKRIQPQ
jgi:hypothetical protein